MANNSKEDFLARLNRIEEKKQKAQPVVKRTGSGAGGPGFTRGFVFAILLMLAVGVGAVYFYQAKQMAGLRDSLAGQFNKISQMLPQVSESLTAVKTAPAERSPDSPLYVASTYGGLVYSPAVLTPDGSEISVGDIVAGFEEADITRAPAKLSLYESGVECRFRAPKAGEKIHSVSVDFGLSKSQVQAFGQPEVEAALLKYLKGFTGREGKRQPDINDFLVQGPVNTIDVFVTDTTAPGYLILQAGRSGLIWNVHAAQGVEIAHIAIISNGPSGVILPHKDTSFERINTTGFGRDGYDGATNDRIDDILTEIKRGEGCQVVPARKPKEHWDQWRKANRSDGVYRNQRNTYFRLFDMYDAWFQRSFGISSDTGIVAAEGAAHILVGPVPREKIPYRKFAGSTVLMSRLDHIFMGTEASRAAKALAIHQKIIDQVAPKGVDTIRPEIMEASQ